MGLPPWPFGPRTFSCTSSDFDKPDQESLSCCVHTIGMLREEKVPAGPLMPRPAIAKWTMLTISSFFLSCFQGLGCPKSNILRTIRWDSALHNLAQAGQLQTVWTDDGPWHAALPLNTCAYCTGATSQDMPLGYCHTLLHALLSSARGRHRLYYRAYHPSGLQAP